MRRRDFIALIGSAAAWPLAARAQQSERVRRIGILMGIPETDTEAKIWVSAFQKGLQEAGWIESRNIRSEYRWHSDVGSIRTDAAELVRLASDAILCRGSTALAALRQETQTVPIVFVAVSDPVGQGVVGSLAHPGGNITGFANHEYTMAAKLLETLREIAPKVSRVAVMHSPSHPLVRTYMSSMERSAPLLGVRLTEAAVRGASDIEYALDSFSREPNGGLVVIADNVTNVHRDVIVVLAARHTLPAIFQSRYFTAGGGLASYGSHVGDQFRRAASYVDRILKGANPGELPVQQPTKFELVINLKTAKALGLDVPDKLLAVADEVIE
jgi:putative ABC transport system substrate-binding protein